MRKSPEQITAGSSITRKLITYLLAGLLGLCQVGDLDAKPNSDDTIENKTPDETRKDIFKGIKIVPDSAPKKSEQPEEKSPKNFDAGDCDDCLFA